MWAGTIARELAAKLPAEVLADAVERIAAVAAVEETAGADIAAEHTVAVGAVALEEVVAAVEGKRTAAAAERTGAAAAVEGVGPAAVAIPARSAALRSLLLRMPVEVVARGPLVAPEVRSVAPEAPPLRKQQPP